MNTCILSERQPAKPSAPELTDERVCVEATLAEDSTRTQSLNELH